MRLLVVDDDAVFRDELLDLLTDDGHRGEAVPSVAAALARLEHEPFDLVLTDLKMPRQGGLELLREIRHRWPRTLVVVVTGYASVETALDAMKLGAFDYVRKPFRLEQIRAALELARLEHEFEAPQEARRDPVREAGALAAAGQHEVLFLGDPHPAPGPHLTVGAPLPSDPVELHDRVRAFTAEHPNAAVVISGVERLLVDHRLEDVVAVLEAIRVELADRGPLRVGFNPRRVGPAEAAALGAAVTGPETHETLEALANPLRRKVLERLALGPGSFGDAMAAAGLDDSPKMSFHLRRLTVAGLLVHEGDRYRLTSRGEAAVRLLAAAAFLPPNEATGSVAFADRKPPGGGRGSERRREGPTP